MAEKNKALEACDARECPGQVHQGDVLESRTATTAALSQRNWTRRWHQLAPQRCAVTMIGTNSKKAIGMG